MKVWEFLNFLRVTYVCIGTSRGTHEQGSSGKSWGKSFIVEKSFFFAHGEKNRLDQKQLLIKCIEIFDKKCFINLINLGS